MTPQSMRTKWWEWLVLAAAIVGGARFALKRLMDGIEIPFHDDFEKYFLPAARAVASGDGPYSVWGYVHPPLTALLVAGIDQIPVRPVTPWLILQTASGVLGAGLAVGALTVGLRVWMRAGILGFACVTLFATRPALRIYFMGQSDLLMLLGMGLSLWLIVHQRHFLAGIALTLPAMVKLWPALFLVWVFTRRLPGRRGVLLGVTAGAIATFASTLPFGGFRGLSDLLGSAARMANQGHTSFSALGAGEALFSDASPLVASLTSSPPLMWITTIVLTIVFIAFLMLALVKLDPVPALLCTVAFVLLLIPTSQFPYQILALPILWFWAAQVCQHPRDLLRWAPLAISAIWWFCYFFWTPQLAAPAGEHVVVTAGSYLLQFGTTAINACAMVTFTVLIDRRDRNIAESDTTGATQVGAHDRAELPLIPTTFVG